ncbi:MAG TPA: hypothetical protein VEG60_26670 [Candidatus Binatia bacterium]|nr:hypothetical protein [Candidatus Binatia bacterium]
MSELLLDPSGGGRRKNRRIGLFLLLFALLYIGGVIVFIIMY